MPTATVVGGGPGGLMAAEVLATAGVQVTVIEHMPSVGRRLVLAGRSGLNLTNVEPTDALVARFGAASSRLADALREFDADALRAWSAGLGEPTFAGSSGRVFPQAFRATPLLRAWLARLADLGVVIETRTRWLGWADDGWRVLRCSCGDEVSDRSTDITILALGGASWPRVGSDGGWVPILRGAGVVVHDLRPANCGVRVSWSTGFLDRFEGVPVKNTAVTIGTAVAVRGDLMITATGLEGGPIYASIPAIRSAIDAEGVAAIHVDLHPDLTIAQLSDRWSKRRAKESMSSALRRTLGLSPVAITLVREATGGPPPSEPDALAELVKAVPLRIHETMPIDRAISSAGGVALDEVDDAFMLRRLPGTYVIGEMLDWEAPTGGYLLQATMSTAVRAAQSAARTLVAESNGKPSNSQPD
jgi:uncharacterized flavoprotein (TIGR03862 family)